MSVNKDSQKGGRFRGVKLFEQSHEPNKIKLSNKTISTKVSFYSAQRMYFAAFKETESNENLH